jgi:hypothetical protein
MFSQRPAARLCSEIPARTVRAAFQKSAVFRQKNDWAKKYWPSFCPIIFLPITLSFDDQSKLGSGALIFCVLGRRDGQHGAVQLSTAEL